jgi:DNA modification methylase
LYGTSTGDRNSYRPNWSHQRTSTPKDIDFLIISIKKRIGLPKHLNLQELHKGSSIIVHPADQKSQFKPASLCRDIVKALTPEGGRIFEPYMGSANLAVEAIKLGRTYYGVETDEKLFNDAVNKVQEAHMAYEVQSVYEKIN